MKTIQLFCIGVAAFSGRLELFCCADSAEVHAEDERLQGNVQMVNVRGQDVQQQQQHPKRKNASIGPYQYLDPDERFEVKQRRRLNVLRKIYVWFLRKIKRSVILCPDLGGGCHLYKWRISDKTPGAYMICEYSDCIYQDKTDSEEKIEMDFEETGEIKRIFDEKTGKRFWTYVDEGDKTVKLQLPFDFSLRGEKFEKGTELTVGFGCFSFGNPDEASDDSQPKNKIYFFGGDWAYTAKLIAGPFQKEFDGECYFIRLSYYVYMLCNGQGLCRKNHYVVRGEICKNGIIYTHVNESPRMNCLIIGSVGAGENRGGLDLSEKEFRKQVFAQVPIPEELYESLNIVKPTADQQKSP